MPVRGVDSTSPEAAYTSKPNIVVPGGAVQASVVRDRAVANAVAQGTYYGPSTHQPITPGAVPRVVAVSPKYEDTGPRSVDIPAGARPGDALLLFVESSQDIWINAEGWVEVPFSPGTPSANTRVHVFWARYRGGLIRPQLVGNGVFGTYNHLVAGMLVVRGTRIADNPFNNHVDSSDNVANTSASVTGLTTTTDNCLMLYAIATDVANSVSAQADASLTGITEQFDYSTALGNAGSICVTSGVKAVAGATGNMTATLASAGVKGMFCIALSPGAIGSGQTPPDDPGSVAAAGTEIDSFGSTGVFTPDPAFIVTPRTQTGS